MKFGEWGSIPKARRGDWSERESPWEEPVIFPVFASEPVTHWLSQAHGRQSERYCLFSKVSLPRASAPAPELLVMKPIAAALASSYISAVFDEPWS